MAPLILTTPPELRHVARVLDFSPTTAWHINFESVARLARELRANFDARYAADGACTVTIWWPVTVDDLQTPGAMVVDADGTVPDDVADHASVTVVCGRCHGRGVSDDGRADADVCGLCGGRGWHVTSARTARQCGAVVARVTP